MTDKQFLIWLHARLEHIHKENLNYDYMTKLLSIANVIPDDQVTPNTYQHEELSNNR